MGSPDPEHVARFAAKIREKFPGCSADEAVDIAVHACTQGSIGNSTDGRRLHESAIRKAVAAHVRHAMSHYNAIVGKLGRDRARDEVEPRVRSVMGAWAAGRKAPPLPPLVRRDPTEVEDPPVASPRPSKVEAEVCRLIAKQRERAQGEKASPTQTPGKRPTRKVPPERQRVLDRLAQEQREAEGEEDLVRRYKARRRDS